MREGANYIDKILDEVRIIKDELHGVWIKNHNMKTSFANAKLLLVAN